MIAQISNQICFINTEFVHSLHKLRLCTVVYGDQTKTTNNKVGFGLITIKWPTIFTRPPCDLRWKVKVVVCIFYGGDLCINYCTWSDHVHLTLTLLMYICWWWNLWWSTVLIKPICTTFVFLCTNHKRWLVVLKKEVTRLVWSTRLITTDFTTDFKPKSGCWFGDQLRLCILH